LKLAILPETDPLRVGPGKPLPVRLDGKPRPGVERVVDWRAAPDQRATDAEGRARDGARSGAQEAR
jgi:hypothetical protein